MKKILMLFIIPIITGVISGIITAEIQNINFISGLIIVFKFIFKIIKSLLLFKLPTLIILIMIFIIILLIKIIRFIQTKKINNSTKEQNEEKTLLEEYVEDEYDGIKYNWKWYNSYEGLKITKLQPICECGCELTYDIFDYYITCPDCKKQYKNNVNVDSAKRVFKNRYRKKLGK